MNLKNNDDIIIDVKIEKKFMFESEQNYFSEEIIIDINESVEMLLYKYAKKTNLIKNIDKLYFFIDKKRIEFHEKNTIRNYFGKYLLNENIKIDIEFGTKKNSKKFIFTLTSGSQTEILFCKYESMEKLLSEYIKIIKKDKNNLIFLASGEQIDLNEKKTIEEYFKNNMDDLIIIVNEQNSIIY